MLTRKKILANVQDCSVEDLVEAILNKTVTMYELKSCGLLPKQQKLVQKENKKRVYEREYDGVGIDVDKLERLSH